MKKLSIPLIMLCLGLAAASWAATGQIKFERWNGITGTAVNNLTDNAAYPDSPSEVTYLDQFLADPTPDPSDYGGRLIGWLFPPVTGQYRFWIASDDSSQLWLSPDANHDHAFQIASISGYSSINQWDKFATQQSSLLTLQAGQPHAIYAIWKEGSGGDHCAVAWGSADAGIPDQTVIQGQYLAANLEAAEAPEPGHNTVDTPRSPGAPLDAQLSWVSALPEGTEWTLRFGTVDPNQNPTAPELDIYQTTDTTVDPGPLEYDTKYYWRVEASADANDFVGATWTFETISRGPYILADPAGAAVEPGTDVVFTAEISAIADVSYQWYREEAPDDVALTDGVKFAGVNTAMLTIMDVTQDDVGDYYLVATSDGLRSAQTQSAALLVKQRLAYYPLDGSGDDVEGIHDLTATGDVAFVDGLEGQAASFDASGDMLTENGTDIGASLLNGLPALSISLWVKANQTNTDRGFIIFQQPAGNDNYDIRYDAAGATGGGTNLIKVGITTTAGVLQVETANDTQTTDWQHLVLTWMTGQPLRVYVNGVETVPTASSAAATNAVLEGFGPIILGRGGKDNQTPDFNSWDGLVDEVQIFNYPLSKFEIAQIYANGSGLSACVENPEYDFNGNCIVDTADLLMMIEESWMTCNVVPGCLP